MSNSASPSKLSNEGRLPLHRAAWVVARRDFLAILMSKTFLLFLLGPLFPFLVGGIAGGIGSQVRDQVDRPTLGVALAANEAAAFSAARDRLEGELGDYVPELVQVDPQRAAEVADPAALLSITPGNLGALISGSLEKPQLYGPEDQIDRWKGRVGLIAAEARRTGPPTTAPPVALSPVATSSADANRARLMTAQGGQLLLFLLTMLLAGMVLSNLVEEKGNKIIEILAAAIPMDAVFMGKLFAMLGISMVGIAVWTLAGGAVLLSTGWSLSMLAAPAVGWPAFILLGIVYFAMGYLLLGSCFLAIGSMATTVREVQTLSMPVTMMQLMVFLFASYAMAQPGSVIEWAAILFPFSSPFTMLARAALDGQIWLHALAVIYQALWVALFIRLGARLFRNRVMQSGPQAVKRRWWHRKGTAQA